MKRKEIKFLFMFCCFSAIIFNSCSKPKAEVNDREYWVKTMLKIVDPVFTNLSNNTLRAQMPVETSTVPDPRNRKAVSHLEALGRSFAGISPWLNLGPDESEEGKLREKYINLCVKAISNAVNPASPDYMTFGGDDKQVLVDAAFLAHGLVRSKDQIWPRLDDQTKQRIIDEFKASRKHKPGEQNWLLFTGMVEAALLQFTDSCNMVPVDYAIMRFKEWYKGDGWYGDGKYLHIDYYNSYVIHPMLFDILRLLKEKNILNDGFYETELKRFIRYADQQEKLISPEGTFPVLGRSMVYRFGAFQALSQISLMKQLPEHIAPAQVRCALTSVIKRQMVPQTFDKNGWLTLGFCGHQPEIGETYISTGSAYLCTFVFLPLGLDPKDEFWTGKPTDWSSRKAWSGEKITIDKALKDKD